jgi:CheY-like chemotaxis protein
MRVNPPASPRNGAPDLSGLTVLVVEDDPESRDLFRTILQSRGATVLEAEEVLTAQEWVRSLKVDLIVTDLALPGRDGASLLKWLREQPGARGGTLPAIAVTAYDKRYPPTEVTGWAAYFRKPLDPDELVQTIAAILRGPGSERAPATT